MPSNGQSGFKSQAERLLQFQLQYLMDKSLIPSVCLIQDSETCSVNRKGKYKVLCALSGF